MAPDEPIRIGVIGCGRVATQRHLPALAGLPGAEVVAVADVDGERAARVAREHGVPRHATDPDALIEDESLDVLAIAVPPPHHAAVAVPALRAGHHVFCEKPLALSLADARAIREAAGAARGRSTMGFNLRSHRLFLEARDVARSGAVGRLIAVRSVYTARIRLDGALPPWRGDPAAGGGALTEIGAHHLDLWRYLTGHDLVWVSAAMTPGPENAAPEHTVVLQAGLDDGTPATGLFSEVTREGQELELWGERARLRVNGYRFDGLAVDPIDSYDADVARRIGSVVRTASQIGHALKARKSGGDYVASYQALWAHFIGAVRTGGELRCSVEDGYQAVVAALAARRSAAEDGRRIALTDIDPENSQT